MSNGVIGVNFNDSTKMMTTGDETTIKYIYRVSESPNQAAKDIVVIYELAHYPPDVKKKVALFKHFCTFFNNYKPNVLEQTKLKQKQQKMKNDFLNLAVQTAPKVVPENKEDI